MPDYLDSLIGRSLEPSLAIRPRIPGFFEPVRPGLGPGGAPFASGEEAPVKDSIREGLSQPAGARTPVHAERREGPSNLHTGLRTEESPAPEKQTPEPLNPAARLAARLAALEQRLAERSPRSLTPAAPVTDPGPLQLHPVVLNPPSKAKEQGLFDHGSPHAVRSGKADDVPGHLPVSPELPRVVIGQAIARPSDVEGDLPARFEALKRELAAHSHPARHSPAPTPLQSANLSVLPVPVQPAVPSTAVQHRPKPAVMRPKMRPALKTGAQTLVQVSIGRVDVRAAMAETPRRDVAARSAAPSRLEEYLRRRNGGE
jgi:hypothetical protein